MKSLHRLILTNQLITASLVNNKVCGGLDDGKFKCHIEIVTRDLDSDGFVTDNQEFLDYVQQTFDQGRYKASCEELCDGITRLAFNTVGGRLEQCHVTVFNLTGKVVSNWKRGDEIPIFPRLATRREKEETDDLDGDSDSYRC